ncbi:MAG: nucleoside triphosphate pyrophosphohydrolase [Eubacteriales bacterium]|nr:nucleoside triphosphate pyrophosphohydrolase [Eubacteriales bacterium]
MHITIAGMNARGEISETVLNIAKSANAVVLQTDISPALGEIAYQTLDGIYTKAHDFDDLADKSCEFLMRDGALFIVLGDVYVNRIAAAAVQRVRQDGGSVTVIPGGDAALCLAFQDGIVGSVSGACIYTASSFEKTCGTDTVLVINEIDSRLKASELKLKLMRCYGDEYTVYFTDIRGMKGKKIPLCMLDAEPIYGYYTSVVLFPCPLEQKQKYTFSDLVAMMDVLRSKNGCPWDLKQTHQSLKRYLIEESYEVLEAIDDNNMDALYDELGDVLLQVVFHAKIAQQHGEFDHTDITTAVCKKMISRHTHIFGSAVADTPEDVIDNWEQIKKDEKGQQTQTDVLKNVPKSMPALMRSGKVQHKAAHVGFDFRKISEAVGKLREEILEIEQDLQNGKDLLDECGDLLFSAVNVVRLAGIEPETALQKATDKFIARFAFVEQIADTQNVDMRTCGIDKLNEIWNEAKSRQNE